MKVHLLLYLATSALPLILAWSPTSYALTLSDSLVEADLDSSHKECDTRHGIRGDFTHYLLSEVYPAALCQSNKEEFTCSYPKNVSSWTIHGLWPTRGKNKGPTCCEPNAHFDKDSIQSLVPRLVKEWTNLKRHHGVHGFYHLWRHEWIVHGTCCPGNMHLEYNYFNTTLTLFEENFNFGNILSKAGIQPSNYYTAGRIRAAFGHGVIHNIKCSKINNKVTLTEIQICLSKRFKSIKCPGGGGGDIDDKRFRKSDPEEWKDNGCGDGSRIFYAPATHTR